MAAAATEQMDDSDYCAAQQALLAAGAVLSQHDWWKVLERIDMADALGSILEPTLYKRGMDRLHKIRDLANAANRVSVAYRTLTGSECTKGTRQ